VPTQKKRDTIDTLRTELSGSRGLILSSYRGLTVSEFAAIRTVLRAQGITYRVVKNRLMRVAATEIGNTTLPDLLKGPTAIAFGSGDEAVLAKTVLGALKAYPAVEVRGAVLGEAILNLAQLTALLEAPNPRSAPCQGGGCLPGTGTEGGLPLCSTAAEGGLCPGWAEEQARGRGGLIPPNWAQVVINQSYG